MRGLELLLTVQGHTHAYALPPDADAHAGQATARFHNGALTVTIPKRSGGCAHSMLAGQRVRGGGMQPSYCLPFPASPIPGSEEDARRWRLQAAADNRIVHISVSKP